MVSAILALTCFAFCLGPVADISTLLSSAGNAAVFVGSTGALLALQVGYFGRVHKRNRRSLRYVALLAQACAVYLPLLLFGDAWLSTPGFLAASLLLAAPPAIAVPSAAAVVASAGLLQARFTGSGVDVALALVSTVVIGLVVLGLTRLTTTVAESHAAREEHTKAAVADERLRFARDLHDLMGISLSAIILKVELAHRLITDDPARVGPELAEIDAIARKAQKDVRGLAGGHRRLSLDEECASVESVLTAADVRVVLRRGYTDLPEQTATLVATVLREGVTNVLRHSRAEWCEISIEQTANAVSIELVNDGAVARGGRGDSGGGTGLRNLTERVRGASGTFHVEHLSDERFRLHASLPLAAPGRARLREAG